MQTKVINYYNIDLLQRKLAQVFQTNAIGYKSDHVAYDKGIRQNVDWTGLTKGGLDSIDKRWTGLD